MDIQHGEPRHLNIKNFHVNLDRLFPGDEDPLPEEINLFFFNMLQLIFKRFTIRSCGTL